jgi:hypothetical protein
MTSRDGPTSAPTNGNPMSLTLRVVRMYGSKSYYGSAPRESLWEAPRRMSETVLGGRSVFVQLGAPVDGFFEAARRGRAYGQLMLEALFGKKGEAAAALDQRLDELLRTPTLFANPDDQDWYVTVWTERLVENVEGKGHRLLGLPDPSRAEREELAATKSVIERLAAAICLVLDLDPISVVMSDRLIVSGPGINSYMVPRSSAGPATISLGRTTAPREVIDHTLAAPGLRGRMFDGSLRWFVAAIEENDPLKRFLWAFIAFEQLVQSHAPAMRGEAFSNIRARSKIDLSESLFHEQKEQSLRVRFAYLAYALRPDDPAEDCAAFETLVRARNDWSHGRGDLAEHPRHAEALRLYRKYATILLNLPQGRQQGASGISPE